IYLGPTLQKRIIPVFHYALQPWGYLVLGVSETVGRFTDLFATVDKKQKIFLRKQASVRLPLEVGMRGYVSEEKGDREQTGLPEPGTLAESVAGRFDLWTVASHRLLERYDLAGVIVDEMMNILQFHGNTDPYLRLPSGKASLNLLDLVREGLSLELLTAIYEAKITNMAIAKE
ncbi:MAG: ATPase, partial [Candidatus Aquicultor sp.]